MIQTQPDAEADEIFRRLRANRDPISILQSIRQARLLLPNASQTIHYEINPQIDRIDSQSSRWSSMKLRARPWTDVASDGIVSALISSFFAWDGIYMLPFVDRVCFVRDMNMRDVSQARFCSPFLVNAMCNFQVSRWLQFAPSPYTISASGATCLLVSLILTLIVCKLHLRRTHSRGD